MGRAKWFDWSQFWGPVCAALTIGCIALLIATIEVDTSGVQPSEHREAVPNGVTQLSASSYIVTQESGVQATDICLKGDVDGNRVEEVRNIEKLEADFVECSGEQVWNAKGPDSPNFGNALLSILSSPFWIVPVAVLLFICMMIWTMPEYRRYKRANREFRLTTEEQEQILKTEWAAGRIDDLEFENKLAEIIVNK